jgi:pyridoxine 5-phosphate synthase
MTPLRLGVNIDHVATLRNARGSTYPDPVRAAHLAREAGADVITAHLREDRRHIRDRDVESLVREKSILLNLEMAATAEMVALAVRLRPHACCIVSERREELTTEGGLDVARYHNTLAPQIFSLREAGIVVSLFIDPEIPQIDAALGLGVPCIELHTGAYCEAMHAGDEDLAARWLDAHREAAKYATWAGLEVHAGHGLTYENVTPIAAIPEISELQIGHFLVGESIFVGFEEAIRRMREIMIGARSAE